MVILTFVLYCKYYLLHLDAPLTTANVFQVVETIEGWKQFCRYLHLQDKSNRKEVIKFFVEEPYFEASWKKVALSLYYCNEESAIDKLFHFMKSPTG